MVLVLVVTLAVLMALVVMVARDRAVGITFHSLAPWNGGQQPDPPPAAEGPRTCPPTSRAINRRPLARPPEVQG